MIQRLFALLVLLLCAEITAAGAQLAIIIDDIGYNLALGRRATDLDGAFTLAILPLTSHTRELAQRGYDRGKEVMLHVPMSNTRDLPLGKGGLYSGMQRKGFLTTLRANLADISHVRGVNNHMGSQLTQELEPMHWLMSELAQKDLYFIDSRTSAASKALAVANVYQLPSMKRDVFLDNSRDREQIQKELLKAIKLAKRQGKAIAIGHPYPETLRVLEEIRALLELHEVELVSVSRLLALPDRTLRARKGFCQAPPVTLWNRPQVLLEPFTYNPLE